MSAPEKIWIAGPASECGHYYPNATEAEGEHGGQAVEYTRSDLIAARASPLGAGVELMKPEILKAAGEEYVLEHVMETDWHRQGRHSAVRGMMVRLGLYAELEAAIDAALAPFARKGE